MVIRSKGTKKGRGAKPTSKHEEVEREALNLKFGEPLQLERQPLKREGTNKHLIGPQSTIEICSLTFIFVCLFMCTMLKGHFIRTKGLQSKYLMGEAFLFS